MASGITKLVSHCFRWLIPAVIISVVSVHAKALDVFFVHSYHKGYPWVQSYYTSFLQELGPYSVKDFEMDTKRLPDTEFNRQAERALKNISVSGPDLVVLSDDNALRLLGPELIRQNIPLVFLGINANPRHYLTMTDKVAGILERPLYKRSVAELHRIIPQLTKILVLLEASTTSQAIIDSSFYGKTRHNIDGTEIYVEQINHFTDWRRRVVSARSQQYDVIILGNYARIKDQTQQPIPLDTVTLWTSKHSPVPVFAFWKFSAGKDRAIGGLLLSGADQGKQAAIIARHYLKTGSMPQPLVRTPKKGEFIFSLSEMKRWRLSLPEDIARQTHWLP